MIGQQRYGNPFTSFIGASSPFGGGAKENQYGGLGGQFASVPGGALTPQQSPMSAMGGQPHPGQAQAYQPQMNQQQMQTPLSVMQPNAGQAQAAPYQPPLGYMNYRLQETQTAPQLDPRFGVNPHMYGSNSGVGMAPSFTFGGMQYNSGSAPGLGMDQGYLANYGGGGGYNPNPMQVGHQQTYDSQGQLNLTGI